MVQETMVNLTTNSTAISNSTNTTSGGRPMGPLPILSVTATGVMYAAYVFIFVVGILGNFTVIYVIGIKHRVARSYDVHIISLAIADILSSIFLPVIQIHDFIANDGTWHILGTFGCKIFVPMNDLTILVSALMLVTISVSRTR